MGLSLNINKKRGIGVALVSFVALALGVQSFATINQSQALASSAPELTRVEPVLWDGSNYKGINVDVSYKNISGLQSITVSTLRADGTVVTKTAKQKLIDGTNTTVDGTFTAPIVFQELNYSEASSGSWNVPSTTVWTKNTAPIKVTVKLETSNGVAERTSDVNVAGKNYLTLLPADTIVPTSTLVVPVSVVGSKFTVTGVAKDNSDLNRVYVQLVDRKNGGRFGGQTINLIGKGTEAAWTATFDASAMGMKDSSYAAHVTVTDMAGNTGANGWSADFKVDLTAPTATIAAPTGVVGRQFTITGTASDNYSLNRVYVQLVNRQNSQRYAGTTIHLIGKGTAADWSYVVNAKDLGLPDGDYAAHVAATDMVGNTGTAGWTADFTVDSTGPTVTLSADREVNPKTANVKVADNLMLGNAYIDLYKNKVVNGVDQVDYSTKFTTWCSASFSGSKTGEKTCNLPTIIESGVYWLKANGFDKQGNSEAVNAQYVKFVVDKTPPVVSNVQFYKDNAMSAMVPNGGFTNSKTFAFNLSASEDTLRYQLKYWNDIATSNFKESKPWAPSDLAKTGKMSSLGVYKDLFTQGNGKHYFSFSACDTAGNCSDFTKPFTVIYDDVRPDAYIKVEGAELTTRSDITVTGLVEKELNIRSHWFEIKTPTGKIYYEGDLSSTANEYSFKLNTEYGPGSYVVRYVATDKAGNRNDDPSYQNTEKRTIVVADAPIEIVKPGVEPSKPVIGEEAILPGGNGTSTGGSTGEFQQQPNTTAPVDAASLVRRQQVAFAAPVYDNGAVLGVNTETDATDDEAEPVVVAQNNTADRNDDSRTGEVLAAQDEKTSGPWKLLADMWYLWVLALAGLAWWIIAAVRRKREDDQYFAS